jgi:acetolactate synthase-1/3 small subunit
MERTETRPNGGTHTISLLVENKPGVLHRIAGLFSRRGYNIASLTVGPTERPDYSRMTIVVVLGSKSVEQVVRQVQKLVPVVEVRELSPQDLVERELLLAKTRRRTTPSCGPSPRPTRRASSTCRPTPC